MLGSHPLAREIFDKAITIRFVEEALLAMFAKGKLHGTVHTSIGQELCGAVVSSFLRTGDTVFSNHRCHGHFIAVSDDVEGLVAELAGRRTGVSGGLGGSQHLYKDGFFSNGIQGGIVPVSAGLALGHKLAGRQALSTVFIGDGTLGQGVVYETMNLASKWDLPLLIVLEDNGISQSTLQEETLAGSVAGRAEAFGIEVYSGDTWRWKTLIGTVDAIVSKIRVDSRPRLLHVRTYRLKAHSKGDDTRDRGEVEFHEGKDPLNFFLRSMTGSEAERVGRIRERVARAEAAAEQAEPAVLPPPGSGGPPRESWRPLEVGPKQRWVVSLNQALRRVMEENENVVLLGEDVCLPYGGAFKATDGLSARFPGRVRNTPISEACIVGVGAGLGLTQHIPIVEIMFGDFIGLAFDQIVNHAAKFHQMYNGAVTCNVIIRTPMGAGRGYGPTHSQTLDRHFLGVPGLRVLAANCFLDPHTIYGHLVAVPDGPALVIENKLLYASHPPPVPEGFALLRSSGKIPAVWLKPLSEHCDVTLLGYGGTAEMLVQAADQLFEQHDIVAQVLVVGQIYPFRVDEVADALDASERLMIVEEGQGFASFGAELVAQLVERQGSGGLKVKRVFPEAHCIPSCRSLEKEYLPSAERILRIAKDWITR